jgi:DNA-binding transcriptional regulator YhcF (GntR family)
MYSMSDARAIRINLDSTEPVYKQIVSALRTHLVNARIKPGETLPPVRQLAVELGVHFNTVAQSYRMLADEGWLDLRRRRGAVVLDRETPHAPQKRERQSFAKRLDEIVAEALAQGLAPQQVAAALARLADGLVRQENARS